MSSDEKTIDMIRELIKEVKTEMQTGKMLTESKAPETKKAGVNDYVTKSVLKIIAESE